MSLLLIFNKIQLWRCSVTCPRPCQVLAELRLESGGSWPLLCSFFLRHTALNFLSIPIIYARMKVHCHYPEMIYLKMTCNIYNAYWKCTMFCPEIDFWSLDCCKQLSTWEKFNYQLQMSREAGSRIPATQLSCCARGYLPPPDQACTLDTSHLSSKNRCSRHLEMKRRWLVIKYA